MTKSPHATPNVDYVAARIPATLGFAGGGSQSAEASAIGLGGIEVECVSPVLEPVMQVRFLLGRADASAVVEEVSRCKPSFQPGQGVHLRFVRIEGLGEAVVWRFAQKRAREAVRVRGSAGDMAGISLDIAFDIARTTRVRVVPEGATVYGSDNVGSTFVVLRDHVSPTREACHELRAVLSSGELFGGVTTLPDRLPSENTAALSSTEFLELPAFTVKSAEREEPAVFRQLSRAAVDATQGRVVAATPAPDSLRALRASEGPARDCGAQQ